MAKKLYPSPKPGQAEYLNQIDRAVAEHGDSMAELKERYTRLCALRDAANAAVAPFQSQLDAVNLKIESMRAEATALAAQIQAARGGGENWLKLKKEIGVLANALMAAK